MAEQRRPVDGAHPPLGILGGMGPLASAEFLKTIYEESLGGAEQNAPAVVLYSDPSMPDRTEAFLNGRDDAVLPRFVEALARLDAEGVSKIVVCCITIHHLLPQVPEALRSRVLSLVDVIVDAVRSTPRRHLLLCTTGTRRLELFERHQRWNEVRDRVIWPDEADQALVHRTIYRLKEQGDVGILSETVRCLLGKYRVDSFVAGCTEIHFASKHFAGAASGGEYGCIDPLSIVARDLARGRV